MTGLDALIVPHQHLIDEAGDPRRHGDLIGLDIGVVGALHEAAAGPVMHEPDPGEDEESRANDDQRSDDDRVLQGRRRRWSRILADPG